ncbi:MAG: anthranilate synthase component I family protein [Planctomycetota bacterium]|nr:MAG: anthranilate synthase component I family protein [Planctomycetota bacterium]
MESESGCLIAPVDPQLDLERAFARLACLPHCVFLDSARRDPVLGRYSFLAADPFSFLSIPADGSDGLAALEQSLVPFNAATIPDLPPFQGGAAGLLSYDLGRSLERSPRPAIDEFETPALAMGLYDVVLAVDHFANRAWLISQGFPELERKARRKRAAERLAFFQSMLERPAGAPARPALERLRQDQLAEQFAVAGPTGLASNFSADAYLAAIRRAIEYVHAGDVFQVNIAQRLLFPAEDDAVALYLRLRQRNAATFAGYFDAGGAQIASASPERFLRVHDAQVEARPIKGTRSRIARPEADLFSGDELQQSEKDRAENVMIVDLLRNDLSRVCRPDSVRVTQLCKLESYAFVQHLVSAVCGTLAQGRTPIDLLRASFPGGSVTGAPKIRAMQVIAELERTARGAYCGSLAYLGFDGSMDSSILIRTITASRGWWQAPVGGGIVAQSVPENEYEETWHKATGLIRALR